MIAERPRAIEQGLARAVTHGEALHIEGNVLMLNHSYSGTETPSSDRYPLDRE